MLPVHRDLLETGVQQPLLFINSFSFQWPENVRAMFKLSQNSNNNSSLAPRPTTSIITLKYVCVSLRSVVLSKYKFLKFTGFLVRRKTFNCKSTIFWAGNFFL